MCPVKDGKLPIYVSETESLEMGFASCREAWNALRKTENPNSLEFKPPAGRKPNSTSIVLNETQPGNRGTCGPGPNPLYDPTFIQFLNDETADVAFEGLTEAEFLGDVGDK